MPLVHIHLAEGKSPVYIKAIADGVHAALCKAWELNPLYPLSRFQLISEYKPGHFFIDKTFMDIKRSDDAVIIYITAVEYTVEQKKKAFAEIVATLGNNPKVRREDVFVTVVETDRESWYLGNELT